MQSCWLPPSQRPSVAEVFLLLSSLLAAEQGMARGSVGEEDEEDEEYEEGRRRRGESEESFERRWDLLRPPAFQTVANERQRERKYIREDRDNSYPLLDPVGNCITPSSSELDDILTVTETSKGLNFEYFWEKAHARRGYKPLPPPQPIPTVNNNHRQSLDTPTVVPVISARSPSLASEYYIRLEEHTPQDKSPTLKGKTHSSFRPGSVCPGDMEMMEIRSGLLGKERVPYCSDKCGKDLQTIRSSEVQVQVPNTCVAEFRETSIRVSDFSIVDLGDGDEEEKKKNSEADKKCSTSSQVPALPPKPRSMSMSSANHLHSRPLPAPPIGYRGLPHYTVTGKIETDPHHMSTCPSSTFDHLGLHRSRQTLPPSPSLSPSLPPSSHPIYPQPPQTCPPPLPPHSKPQKICPVHNTGETYSRYNKPQMQRSHKDPLSCDLLDRENGTRHSASLHNSKETSRTKDFDSPIRRENPLRPIYRNLPRPQPADPQIDRQSSSSPTYSDEDDSPFMSPERSSSGTTVIHSSLSEERDPMCAELFSRGMKRTQSRLDTILPTIWKEDAERQAERLAAAKKSPMHLFLTEISSVTESNESKSDASWKVEKGEKRDGEKWGNFVLPSQGMRRSQSLITELGSTGQSWESEKCNDGTVLEDNNTVTKESFQRDLFLTEIDTGRMESHLEEGSQNDSVKYLYPAGSRLRPYVCAPSLPSYTHTEETYSKGIWRSRSLLSEITTAKQETDLQHTGREPRSTEMTREEFLKEIQSAETFLTEIISRQNSATNKKQTDSSYSPSPLSPEYESICIDPNSAQTITFRSESSVRAKGNEDTQTEAIYAQVTKRARKSEIKVSMKPEIPILHIGSNKLPRKVDGQGNNADHSQTGGFVFSEIMPKNGLLHNRKEAEDCSDGPALPERGEQMDVLARPHDLESSEGVTELNTNETPRAVFIGNGEIMKGDLQVSSSKRGEHLCGKADITTSDLEKNIIADDDLENSLSLGSHNSDESLSKTNNENLLQYSNNGEEKNCYISQTASTPAGTPVTPDWDPSSDVSIVTPTDSALSPMTSNSTDCLTPSDSWMSSGGGAGNGGWRALGNETPHRDSAYFSDSDWEGEGLIRRSSDGITCSRPSSSRGGDWGTLTGIEEKTEEEGEMREKSPLKNNMQVSDKKENGETMTIEMCQETCTLYHNIRENEISHIGVDKDFLKNGLGSTQRDNSDIFPNESKGSTLLCDDLQAKHCVDLIDRLFSGLDDEPLKELPHSGSYPMDNHFTDGIISQLTDCRYPDLEEKELTVQFESIAETNILIDPKDCSSNDCSLSAAIDVNSLTNGSDRVESATPTVDSRASGLSKLYIIQATDAKVRGESLSVVETCDDGMSVYDKVSGLTLWAENSVAEMERHKESPALDNNELGLRNLRCSDGSKDKKTTAEMEKQLAAAELSNAMKEKSPLKGAINQVCSTNNVGKDPSEGLDVKTKELWVAPEEDEACAGSGVVMGELDCHSFSQSKDLHLSDENDQWASPERRCQDTELRSEFFSGLSNKEWEVGERLIVGKEFWETEENDELAGSEPHPAVLEGCEETWNDETQGLGDDTALKQRQDLKDGGYKHSVEVLNVQQEENIENLLDTSSINLNLTSEPLDIEVENVELPEKETFEKGEISSFSEMVRDSKGLPDSTETEENQNFNSWPPSHLCKSRNEEQMITHVDKHTGSNLETTEAPDVQFSDLDNVETDSRAERTPGLARRCREDGASVTTIQEDNRDVSLPSNPVSCSINVENEVPQPFPQLDNFSSVDFPSPPPSVDLDVQDDKLESLDDSFPSPPPSVVEADISHINLEDFIANTETEPCTSLTHNTDVSEPPATTQSKGISANMNPPSVPITIADENLTPNKEKHDELNALFQSTLSSTSSSPQVPLNNIPELLISEWKDLDEEPLEDFEKLEQLCCISGDEEDSLGDLFLGNLELLESLKKIPDQKDSSVADSNTDEMHVSTPEESGMESSDNLGEPAPYVILDPQDRVPPQEKSNDGRRSAGPTADMKDQASFSKMTTKNGLMMQVSVFS